MTLCRELKYKRLILRNACGSKAVFIGNIFSARLVIKTSTRATITGGTFAVVSGYKVKHRFCAHLYQDKRTP